MGSLVGPAAAAGQRSQLMPNLSTRRDLLKSSLALAGLGVAGLPEWVLPALAQGETVVPFTDLPATIN